MRYFLIGIIGILCFFSPISLYSQTNNKLWGGLEVGYGISLSDNGKLYDTSYKGNNRMALSSIRGVFGYYIIPSLSVGAGIGLSSYTKPQLNTIPVFLDFRFHPLPKNTDLFINADLGHTIATSESDSKGKLIAELSIGYNLFRIGKLSIVPAIGYNYVNYSISYPDNDGIKSSFSQHRNSIFLKVGIIY